MTSLVRLIYRFLPELTIRMWTDRIRALACRHRPVHRQAEPGSNDTHGGIAMPARGRELHDVREALARLVKRYPRGKGRRALDDDLQAVLEGADVLVAALTPTSRSGDGEESPGERATRKASIEGGGINGINASKTDANSGYSGLTPGQRAAARRSDGKRFTHLGQERGARRGRPLVDLHDLEDFD